MPFFTPDFDLHFSPLREDDPSGDHPLPETWREAILASSIPGELIGRLWEPILTRARGFVFRLESITREIRIARTAAGVPRGILYVTRSPPNPGGWFGGIPAAEEDIQIAERENRVSIPASYREFSRIHDGFFQLRQDGCAFLPLRHLQKKPSKGLTEQDPPSGNGQSGTGRGLMFFVGTGGAAGYFDLAGASAGGDYRTILIDANSNPAPVPKSFWSFLKDFTIREFTP